jgi:polyhydroxyalkanoate synthesis repressor PhaR
MSYVIKRYSNRKLYDTQDSRYVTLDEIEELIQAGREISVVDAASGEDLTSVTLAQIILEKERAHRAALPSAFLHQLIKHGEMWHTFVRESMRSSLAGLVSSQREMDRVLRDWAARAGWAPASVTAEAPPAHDEDARESLRDEVDLLREKVKALEERLEKRR